MIYLLHFDRPYKHAKHYLGFVENEAGLQARIDDHALGRGARLMEVILDAGIGFKIARLWNGDRKLERKLKNRKKSTFLCPICNPDAFKLAKGNVK